MINRNALRQAIDGALSSGVPLLEKAAALYLAGLVLDCGGSVTIAREATGLAVGDLERWAMHSTVRTVAGSHSVVCRTFTGDASQSH